MDFYDLYQQRDKMQAFLNQVDISIEQQTN
jgi:hypothetical protein